MIKVYVLYPTVRSTTIHMAFHNFLPQQEQSSQKSAPNLPSHNYQLIRLKTFVQITFFTVRRET